MAHQIKALVIGAEGVRTPEHTQGSWERTNPQRCPLNSSCTHWLVCLPTNIMYKHRDAHTHTYSSHSQTHTHPPTHTNYKEIFLKSIGKRVPSGERGRKRKMEFKVIKINNLKVNCEKTNKKVVCCFISLFHFNLKMHKKTQVSILTAFDFKSH